MQLQVNVTVNKLQLQVNNVVIYSFRYVGRLESKLWTDLQWPSFQVILVQVVDGTNCGDRNSRDIYPIQ